MEDASYDQIIADVGEVRSFVNIRGAETRHMEALAGPPGDASVQAACKAGTVAESDGSMYERPLATRQRRAIATVLRKLQPASQQRHLSTRQRCAKRRTRGDGACGGRREEHRHGRV